MPDYELNYVFAQMREDEVPLIVAVLHEKIELMVRLRERLDRLLGPEK